MLLRMYACAWLALALTTTNRPRTMSWLFLQQQQDTFWPTPQILIPHTYTYTYVCMYVCTKKNAVLLRSKCMHPRGFVVHAEDMVHAKCNKYVGPLDLKMGHLSFWSSSLCRQCRQHSIPFRTLASTFC
ncbi:unnamed protein product [Ceratitis capitata]|uniref:(Mediterranean fruit fly) hypothetical protein n=1 Tax=Ceratitis capitata TaxID=7213 RepID=A0A811VL49_CERCA|nr:unnamed protein product [Ceratitis capitata]